MGTLPYFAMHCTHKVYNYYEGIDIQESRYPQRSSPDRSETESEVSRSKPKTKHNTSSNKSTIGRLFVLDLSAGHITSLNADGSDQKVIVSGCRHPESKNRCMF
jgi:hypothetical protein